MTDHHYGDPRADVDHVAGSGDTTICLPSVNPGEARRRRRIRTHYYFVVDNSSTYFCGKPKMANSVRPGDPDWGDSREVVCPTCEVVKLNIEFHQAGA